jgi:hypothetical protein
MTTSQKDTADYMRLRLNALMTEWADYKEHAERIELMILALAVEQGLLGVLPDPAG